MEWGGAHTQTLQGNTPFCAPCPIGSVVPKQGKRLSENQSLQRGSKQWVIGVTDFGVMFALVALSFDRFHVLVFTVSMLRLFADK